jgi:hypothetical protein
MSDAELAEISIIVEEIVEKASQIVIDKCLKLNSVEVYHEIFMEALKKVLDVYDLPKPCKNFESTIDAWKKDRPAQLAVPDTLITPKFLI